MYSFYAQGKDTYSMKAVVGEDALTADDHNYLLFHDRFETEFVKQNFHENRTIFDSLDKAWELLTLFPKEKISKISDETKERYYERAGREFAEREDKQI